mgnify:CR=1 FL=1
MNVHLLGVAGLPFSELCRKIKAYISSQGCQVHKKFIFFSVSGSGFIELFAGVGAARIRELFKKANEVSPSIIFIDEIDTIGKTRKNNSGTESRSNSLSFCYFSRE